MSKYMVRIDGELLIEITGNCLFDAGDTRAMDVDDREADFIRDSMTSLDRIGHKAETKRIERLIEVIRP